MEIGDLISPELRAKLEEATKGEQSPLVASEKAAAVETPPLRVIALRPKPQVAGRGRGWHRELSLTPIEKGE